ncbi:MAG: DUF1570 domain-containing protein [Planctomycetes bacterium]|nr:DUF1570 domain-containing protein [Planctomycetota bacterium]
MIQADVGDRHVEGRPTHWSADRVQMMLRDGQFLDFPTAEARNFRRTSDRFRPYSAGELRTKLFAEFGPGFDVTGTGHYLVVHPKGQKDRWASRFEDLYRSFVHYFSVRGLRIKEPEFPLVAVVWGNKQQFFNYAATHGVNIGGNTVGYYSPATNRVHLYDATAGQSGANWQHNADTIIHEVTHQTAFNTGVHTRFAGCPRWLAEGLGTLFEARGIHSSREFPNRTDRINRQRLTDYRRLFPKEVDPAYLGELISSDRAFDRDISKAYALSWALTFYLVETQPRRYAEYLALTAARQPGEPYPEAKRLADFTKIFGDNFSMLAARLSRFMVDVK